MTRARQNDSGETGLHARGRRNEFGDTNLLARFRRHEAGGTGLLARVRRDESESGEAALLARICPFAPPTVRGRSIRVPVPWEARPWEARPGFLWDFRGISFLLEMKRN